MLGLTVATKNLIDLERQGILPFGFAQGRRFAQNDGKRRSEWCMWRLL